MHNRYWFLLSKKICGNATDAELLELDDMLAENPDWQYSVENVTKIWEAKQELSDAGDAFASHLNRMEKLGHDTAIFSHNDAFVMHAAAGTSKKTWFKIGLIAASVLVALACWLLVRPSRAINASADTIAANTSNIIVTKSGDRRKMLLPDGTQVWLNAESKLEYSPAFGKTDRSVKLSGEAYFDVVKNVQLPFTIETNKIHIKVTGTAFNVKAYPGDKVSETSLIRGRVEVTVNARPDEKYILKPNEKLVIRDEELVKTAGVNAIAGADKKLPNEPLIQLGYLNYLGDDSSAVETSWVYERLVFDDESFGEIATKMERWYGVHIQITDPEIAAQQLTYSIRRETIAEALRNMKYALRFNYTINGSNITITR